MATDRWYRDIGLEGGEQKKKKVDLLALAWFTKVKESNNMNEEGVEEVREKRNDTCP